MPAPGLHYRGMCSCLFDMYSFWNSGIVGVALPTPVLMLRSLPAVGRHSRETQGQRGGCHSLCGNEEKPTERVGSFKITLPHPPLPCAFGLRPPPLAPPSALRSLHSALRSLFNISRLEHLNVLHPLPLPAHCAPCTAHCAPCLIFHVSNT